MFYEDTVIETEVYLEPSRINGRYKAYLLDKIRQQYENTANEKFGIIQKVNSIKDLEQQCILDNSTFVTFLVKCAVLCYMPKKGDVLNIPITKITPYGIFISEHQIRILIPQAYLPEYYSIQREGTTFQLLNQQNDTTFCEGDQICVVIEKIKYEKNGFSCLALINENI